MCQYTPRYAVGTHRVGTICPVAGSSGEGSARLYAVPSRMSSTVRPASPPPSTLRTRGAGTKGGGTARKSNTASVIVGGIDGADLIGLAIFEAIVGDKDQPVNTASIAAAVLLIVVPTIIAVLLGAQCRVWNVDGLSALRGWWGFEFLICLCKGPVALLG